MLTYCEHTIRAVCTDLDAELAECNGETGHVHLLVTRPPWRSPSWFSDSKVAPPTAVRREYTGACVRARMRGHL